MTSTAPTSNPNLEISDNHQSSTTNMQAMSVSSSLPSSNIFSITTSTNMSSGVTTNGVASVSSTSSMPLQPSSVSESDQMGMRSTMAGGSTAGVGGASGTAWAHQPTIRSREVQTYTTATCSITSCTQVSKTRERTSE